MCYVVTESKVFSTRVCDHFSFPSSVSDKAVTASYRHRLRHRRHRPSTTHLPSLGRASVPCPIGRRERGQPIWNEPGRSPCLSTSIFMGCFPSSSAFPRTAFQIDGKLNVARRWAKQLLFYVLKDMFFEQNIFIRTFTKVTIVTVTLII